MKKKVAFFDIDGTIVAPLFRTDSGEGNYVLGFRKPEWIKFCNERQESAYADCMTVHKIMNIASALHIEGWDVKILTVTMSPGEKVAKLRWFDYNNHSSFTSEPLFSEIIFVGSPEEKIKYIEDYVKSNEMNPKDCILIEDDIGTVWGCQHLGISAFHLSHVLATENWRLSI